MASPTRPEPMNASPHHSKVKVALTLSDPLYVAGGFVSGKMEVECRMDKGLGLGTIMVELFAIEELTSRDHSATSTFLHSRRLFQGPSLPPSNAVSPYPIPGSLPLPANYYHARKGSTTFIFRIPLPVSSPSALSFGSGLARVKYEARASVAVAYKGENRLVTDKKEVDVVESFEEDFNRREPEGVIVGENGKIWIQARLLGGFMVSGQPACVELQVKNHSTKKNSGLAISLIRNLHFPQVLPTQNTPFHFSDTLTNVAFRGPEYVIQPGSEGVANLVFDTPRDARGVKGGLRMGDDDATKTLEPLFEVRSIVSVKMTMGFGSKDIVLDLPVTILHPRSLPTLPPDLDLYPPPHLDLYPSPHRYPMYDPSYRPSVSPPAICADRPPGPYAYLPAPISPPPASQPWLPPNASSYPYPYFSPPPSDHPYYYPPPPNVMLPLHSGPLSLPMRPSSTEPVPSQLLYTLPSGLPSPSVTTHHLIPFSSSGEQVLQNLPSEPRSEPEEGKGERASRISRHLRMSTRARSASPTQHRFPMPIPSSSQQVTADYLGQQPSQPVSIPAAVKKKPSMHLATDGLPGSPNTSNGVLHSPRPVLSPKTSYDPYNTVGSRSERVEILERLAAEVDKENCNMSGSGVITDSPPPVGTEKTLPAPPIPSWTEKRALPVGGIGASLNRLKKGNGPTPTPESAADSSSNTIVAGDNEVLVLPRAKDPERTPPTPTLTAVRTLKLSKSRAELSGLANKLGSYSGDLLGLPGPLSGLDALEARLVAEVGTRKVEQDNRRADVRSILAIPIEIPTAKGRRPSREEVIGGDPTVVLRAQGGDEINESAISSLTLAGEEISNMAPKEVGRGRTLRQTSRSRSRSRSISRTRTVSRGFEEAPDPHKVQNIGRPRKASGGKKNGTSQKEAKSEKSEGRKMRKAVHGRVAAWLGTIDPDIPPPQVPTPPPTSPLPLMSPPIDGVFISSSHPSSPNSSSEGQLPQVESAQVSQQDEDKDISAAPNPRSSGFVPLATLKAVPKEARIDGSSTPKPSTAQLAWLAKLEQKAPQPPYSLELGSKLAARYPPPVDPAVKYDVRSARGGKGGRVATVASIWASTAQGGPVLAKLGPSKPVQNNLMPKRFEIGKVKAAQGVTSASSSSTEGEDKAKGDMKVGRGGGDYKKARMVKSSSVPAVVSSSLAIPTLSSTASLARSGDYPFPRERPGKISRTFETIPTIEEDSGDKPNSAIKFGAGKPVGSGIAIAKAELAFGQARLRELIKKYQGGTS